MTRTSHINSDTIRSIAGVSIIVIAALALGVTAAPVAAQDTRGPTNVKLIPSSTSIGTNETVTYDLVLTNASGGVGTFDNITVDVGDASVATITGADTPIDPATATIVNESHVSFSATFGGDTNDTGTVQLGSITLAANGTGTTALNVTVTKNIYREDGTIYTIDGVQHGSLTVSGPPSKAKLTPASGTALTNGTTTFDIVLTNATGGVGTFDTITVTVDNTSVVTVRKAETPIGPATATRVNASQASFSASFGGNTSDSGTVRLGSLTLAGNTSGTTDLHLTLTGSIYTETGTSYSIAAIKDASVSVQEPPTVLKDTKVNDTDGDGKVDDLNGNNEQDRGDAQALFANLNQDSVTSNVQLFDYNGNGRVDRGDVQALFAGA